MCKARPVYRLHRAAAQYLRCPVPVRVKAPACLPRVSRPAAQRGRRAHMQKCNGAAAQTDRAWHTEQSRRQNRRPAGRCLSSQAARPERACLSGRFGRKESGAAPPGAEGGRRKSPCGPNCPASARACGQGAAALHTPMTASRAAFRRAARNSTCAPGAAAKGAHRPSAPCRAYHSRQLCICAAHKISVQYASIPSFPQKAGAPCRVHLLGLFYHPMLFCTHLCRRLFPFHCKTAIINNGRQGPVRAL